MKFKYFMLTPLLLLGAVYFLTARSSGTAFAGAGNRTGSPGSSGTCASCHSGGSFGATISATVTDLSNNPVTSYIPGNSYYIEFQMSSTSGSPLYSFQSVMLNSLNANTGDFDSVLTTQTRLVTVSGKEYAEQSAKSPSGNFKVRWVAPATGTGTVTLYYIGNAVNNNFGTSGDQPTAAQSLTLTEQLVFTASAIENASVGCNGGSDGEAKASVVNGVAPYTYAWSTGTSTGPTTNTADSISGLAAGTYTVTVTDGNSATSIDSIVITEPLVLSSTINVIDESCYQSMDGSAALIIAGGTAPYNYSWSNGQTTSTATGLTDGDYFVTITDANGCTAIDTANIVGPSQIIIGDSVVDPNCTIAVNGAIYAFVSGGVGPYTYNWSNGQQNDHITILGVGTYSLTVTDASGCQEFATYTLSSPNLPPSVSFVSTDPTCYTSMNGHIVAQVTGDGPFEYSWNTGDTSATITNLDTGAYFLIVKDANECFLLVGDTLGSANLLPLVDLGPDTVWCDTSFGNIAISGGSFNTGTTYLWSTNETTAEIFPTFAGEYSLEVTDSVGCINSDTVEIGSTTCISGVVDLFANGSLSIYPTPTSDILQVQTSEEGNVILYDLAGNSVYSTKINRGNTQLDLAELPKGTYIFMLETPSGKGIKKVVLL